jgi:hypothetical protein
VLWRLVWKHIFMNKLKTHQTKHTFCTNRLDVADGHLLPAEDQLFLTSLKPRLDRLIREPSEEVICTILAYAQLL